MFAYSATQIFGILAHTQTIGKLGFLEYFLVTPSHHRVHHGSNVRYLDKNMGMCLIIWDKLFGTFQAELAEEPVRYGLTKRIEDRGPVNIVLHEWKDMWKDVRHSALPWSRRLGYILRGPGWNPREQVHRDLAITLDFPEAGEPGCPDQSDKSVIRPG